MEVCFGGIVSITGQDFERVGGFPNYWAWGFEDNMFQDRVTKAGLVIDRSQYYPIADKNIMHFSDGVMREVNRNEFERHVNYTTDGLRTLNNVAYREDGDVLHVMTFECEVENRPETNRRYDMRSGNAPFVATVPPPRLSMRFH